MRDDTGSLTAWLAAMSVALFALLGLVIDGGEYLGAKNAAYGTASQAARAGATAIEVSGLEAGTTVVDPAAAISRAEAALAEAGHPGVAWVSGSEVCASFSYQRPTAILGIVGIDDTTISARACATDLTGVASPGG